MKYYLMLFCCAVVLPTVCFADVHINEIAWMGTADSQYSEWIELYNDGADAVSLAGWTIYKTADTLLFTLTKTIAPGGYILVERTTSSAPDAVPNIDDEQGTFGGGGLRNTGEDLVLKDKDGTVIETLSYASGWPAGDAESKDTMQWNGEKWITAPGTPDAANASTATEPPTDTASDSDTSTTTSTSSQTSKKTSTPVLVPKKPSLAIVPPTTLFTGVSNEFSATATGIDSAGYFYWNMGDGTTLAQNILAPVKHTYQFNGTYTVSLAHFSSTGAAVPEYQTLSTVSVLNPSISIVSLQNGTAMKITNSATKAVDIGGWPIHTSIGVVTLPLLTIINAHSFITIPARMFGVPHLTVSRIDTPDGGLTDILSVPVVAVVAASVPPVSTSSTEAFHPVAVDDGDQSESVPVKKQNNHTKIIIFGVVALVITALFLLLERIKVRQE